MVWVCSPPDSGRVRRAWNSSQRGGPISTGTRVNERIRVPEVRLIGPRGSTGIACVSKTHFASPRTQISDLSKLPQCQTAGLEARSWTTASTVRGRAEGAQSRRNQQQTVVKEQKLRPKIDDHDYETKKGHVVRFLEAGSKVKVTIITRGREQSRPRLSIAAAAGCIVADYGLIETSKQDGRNMTMVLAPHRGAATRA